MVRDVETVEQMVQQTAETGLGALTVLVSGLVIIGVRTPEFLPVFLVVVPAAALLVARLRAACAPTTSTSGTRSRHCPPVSPR